MRIMFLIVMCKILEGLSFTNQYFEFFRVK